MSIVPAQRHPSRGRRASTWRRPSRHLLALMVPLVGLIGAILLLPVRQLPTDDAGTNADVNGLQARARRADDLTWLRAELGPHTWPVGISTRSDVVHEKDRLRASGDAFGAARLSGIL